MIVTDFDGTLTHKGGDECHTLFRACWPDDYGASDWWVQTHNKIVECEGGTLTRAALWERVLQSSLRLTPHAVRLLRDARDPVYIVSAGITDVIEAVLQIHGLQGRAAVVANKLEWNPNETLRGFTGPLVTSFNKVNVFSCADIPPCTHVHVLGDQADDLQLCSEALNCTRWGVGCACGDRQVASLDDAVVSELVGGHPTDSASCSHDESDDQRSATGASAACAM